MTTVCLTFDFDAYSIWVSTFRQTSATPLSRGEFSGKVGVGRVLKLLASKNVRGTFFVPAHTAAAFVRETLSIVEAGHEVALHGYCHESPVDLTRDAESRNLDRSIAKLRSVLGADFAPAGYRSPAWDLSVYSVGLLEERGVVYDSSMMGTDFVPYLARRGDTADEDGFQPGVLSSIVEIPVAWELDDFPYFNFTNRPLFGALRSPMDVFYCWRDEFDFCHCSVEEGVFTLTMHPEIIGRGPRIEMLGRLIDYMKATPDVRFSRVDDEAVRRKTRLRTHGARS